MPQVKLEQITDSQVAHKNKKLVPRESESDSDSGSGTSDEEMSE